MKILEFLAIIKKLQKNIKLYAKRIMKIMKFIKFRLGIMKIMEILKFYARITKTIEMLEFHLIIMNNHDFFSNFT